jgi:hypothetical protein
VNDEKHGKGKEEWDFGKISYVGDFNNGQKTGKGSLSFNGSKYEGDFVDGKF